MASEPSAPPARASDSLMTQVNPDNILQVRNALRQQLETMLPALNDARWAMQLGRCGGDPISAHATPMFQRKITDVLEIHWAHYREIGEAVDRLTETAKQYGYTEQQITDSFDRYWTAP